MHAPPLFECFLRPSSYGMIGGHECFLPPHYLSGLQNRSVPKAVPYRSYSNKRRGAHFYPVVVYFILSRLLFLAFSANLGLLCMPHPGMGPLV